MSTPQIGGLPDLTPQVCCAKDPLVQTGRFAKFTCSRRARNEQQLVAGLQISKQQEARKAERHLGQNGTLSLQN